MENWVNLKEAVEASKAMVATVVITLVFKNNEVLTFVVEVQGISQMVFVVKELDKLKAKKKIKSYNINNLTSFPAVDVASFKKMLAEAV